MTSQHFDGPRLKASRARSHIADLESLEAKLIKEPPFSVKAEDHPENPALWRRVVRDCRDLPSEVPLLIGDAIHNLRASLDLLACELVLANNNDPKNVYFPFCERSEDLDATIKRRKIDRCAPEVVDLVRSLKPYKGGNDALRAIHDLDIADKHKLLIPTLMAITQPVLSLDFVNQIYIQRSPEDCEVPLVDGAILLDEIPKEKPESAFEGSKDIGSFVFAPDQPLAGKHVTQTLHELARLVDGVVEQFASLVLKNGPAKDQE